MPENRSASEAGTEAEGDLITFTSSRFGEVRVAANRVLDFPRGLVGIAHARRFVFLHKEESAGPFFWLHAVDDPALAFVVCDPRLFFPDYLVPLSVEEQKLLDIENPDDGLVCVILVVPKDPHRITANLRGPIVVNPERRIGMQLVLAGDGYPVRASIFGAGVKGGAECSS